MDLDWLWDVTIREYRLDLKRIFYRLRRESKEYVIGVTSMETGGAVYLRPDEDTLEHYLKVSSSIPVVYRNILEIDGEKVTDGGVADSIPVIEAYRRGASDITVVRTRSSDYVKKRSRGVFVYQALFKAYPRFVETMNNRHVRYMEAVRFIRNPPTGVRIREIAPPGDVTTRRATKDHRVLGAAYRRGIECGERFMASL